MMSGYSREEERDLAALYSLGALRGDELHEFEQHLEEGCEFCSAEIAAFSPVITDLSHAAPSQTPQPELRDRVLARIQVEGLSAAHPIIENNGVKFVRSEALAWNEGNAPAVDIKVLSLDEAREMITYLVRMAPGSRIRPHRHAGVEESYLLEGDLVVDGIEMKLGDYCRAEARTRHSDVFTRNGCVFISVCSTKDEWFELQ